VGNDDFGKIITQRLHRDGVDISQIKVLDDYTTGVAFVTYFDDGSRKFIFHLARAATGQIYPQDIDSAYLKDLTYLHVVGSTLSTNENCRTACFKAVEFAKNNGAKISFDPNFRPELVTERAVHQLFMPIIEQSHIVFPTEAEIKVLTGDTNLDRACKKLLTIGPEIIAVKQGSRGSTVYSKDEKHHIDAFNITEIDPTGAGDCYCAGFICQFLKGGPLKEAARFANAVAALAVSKKGPMEGIPSYKEVLQFEARKS